jgi:hypothetical protein
MNDTEGKEKTRELFLFQYLVMMFQSLALQQMGKFINPVTGKLERDLQQARITIDMLQMIREKTAGNLDADELKLINGVLSELQMNYVDEAARGDEETPQDAEQADDSAGEETGEAPAADADRTEKETVEETKADDSGSKGDPAREDAEEHPDEADSHARPTGKRKKKS